MAETTASAVLAFHAGATPILCSVPSFATATTRKKPDCQIASQRQNIPNAAPRPMPLSLIVPGHRLARCELLKRCRQLPARQTLPRETDVAGTRNELRPPLASEAPLESRHRSDAGRSGCPGRLRSQTDTPR